LTGFAKYVKDLRYLNLLLIMQSPSWISIFQCNLTFKSQSPRNSFFISSAIQRFSLVQNLWKKTQTAQQLLTLSKTAGDW